MSSILVTGGWGFIGSHLVEYLLKKGYHVIVLDQKGPEEFFNHNINKVEWIKDDISNINNYELNVQGVFHLAGRASVKDSVIDPITDYSSNLKNTFELLEWSRSQKLKRFVFSSSVSVLGSNIVNPVREDVACMPRSPYGASKSASECYCITYFSTYGVPTIVSRLFNVYGSGQSHLFISDIIYKLINNSEILELWGGGEQIRDYLHIDDLVEGLVLLYENGENGNIYNLASGVPVSLKRIALELSIEINGKTPEILNNKTTYKGDIEKWYADVSKIGKLGYSPSKSLKVGLSETAKWYMDNLEWFNKIKSKL